MKEVLRIYTDGACSGNPGAGGWAAVLIYGSVIKEISGYEANTTNNRMELMGTIKGLQSIKKSCEIQIYSDSAYLVNAVNQGWLDKWQKNGWQNSDKKQVKNLDLWVEICELNRRFSPKYIKVKGHSDNEFNNRADELAVAAIKSNDVR